MQGNLWCALPWMWTLLLAICMTWHDSLPDHLCKCSSLKSTRLSLKRNFLSKSIPWEPLWLTVLTDSFKFYNVENSVEKVEVPFLWFLFITFCQSSIKFHNSKTHIYHQVWFKGMLTFDIQGPLDYSTLSHRDSLPFIDHKTNINWKTCRVSRNNSGQCWGLHPLVVKMLYFILVRFWKIYSVKDLKVFY